MSRRFRCGRVVLTLDGKVTKLGLLQGGGVRSCEWNDNDMNFDEVRHRLINIYNLGDTEHEILLYDFLLRPLDVSQYETLFEYVHNNGLIPNCTIIYLGTRQVDDRHSL